MTDPLSTLAIATMAVAVLSLLLARLIPDQYDRLERKRVQSRPTAGR